MRIPGRGDHQVMANDESAVGREDQIELSSRGPHRGPASEQVRDWHFAAVDE